MVLLPLVQFSSQTALIWGRLQQGGRRFMIRTIADGKSRFALLHGWIAAHRGPLPGEISGQERPRRTFGFARFWEDFHR